MMPSQMGQPKREDPMRPHVDERRQHPLLAKLDAFNNIGNVVIAVIVLGTIGLYIIMWVLDMVGIGD
jgi:hypothetical protein